METRLLTIMFVDMAGYTRKSAQQTLDEMKLFHDEMQGFVKQHLEKYQGVLVKSLGDGFLARFDSPTNAVQCGLEMQKKLETRNANMMNPEHLVRFRIGINSGEVGVDETGDLFGDPVNVASRIQTFAEPNEVFISESTYLAMNRNEFGTMDLGPQELKNVTREIRVYKILKRGSPGITLPGPKAGAGGKGSAAAGGAPASGSGPAAGLAAGLAKAGENWPHWKTVGGIVVILVLLNIFAQTVKQIVKVAVRGRRRWKAVPGRTVRVPAPAPERGMGTAAARERAAGRDGNMGRVPVAWRAPGQGPACLPPRAPVWARLPAPAPERAWPCDSPEDRAPKPARAGVPVSDLALEAARLDHPPDRLSGSHQQWGTFPKWPAPGWSVGARPSLVARAAGARIHLPEWMMRAKTRMSPPYFPVRNRSTGRKRGSRRMPWSGPGISGPLSICSRTPSDNLRSGGDRFPSSPCSIWPISPPRSGIPNWHRRSCFKPYGLRRMAV